MGKWMSILAIQSMISDSSISRLTDKIMPIIKEWQERPLEEIYAVVYMDAIHFHVRSEGRIINS